MGLKKNSPGCMCCDGCECNPQAWDWTVAVAALSCCTDLNATYSFPAASFAIYIDQVGDCDRWISTVTGSFATCGGGSYTATLELEWISGAIDWVFTLTAGDMTLVSTGGGGCALSAGCNKPSAFVCSASTVASTCHNNVLAPQLTLTAT